MKIFKTVILFLVIMNLCVTPISKAGGDSSPPVIESIEIIPQVVEVGEKLTVSAKITDDVSGVKSADIRFYYNLPNVTKMNTIFLKYDSEKDLWVGEYTASENDINGTWKLDSYQVEDNAGNRDYKYREQIPNYTNYFYIINNPKEVDTIPPVVEEIKITPEKVEVGQEFTISVKVSDSSGIDGFQTDFEIYEPVKKRLYKNINYTFDEKTGYWSGKYKILEGDINGTWYLKLFVRDKLSNSTYVDTTKYKIEVINPLGGDFSPPKVEWLDISPREVTINDIVLIRAKVSDDFSGVDGVHVSLFPPSRNSERFIHLYDRDKDGVWEATYKITKLDELGKWNLDAIIAYDKANNAKQAFPKDYVNFEDLNITVMEDKKPPAKPMVNPVTDKSKHVTGTTESEAVVTLTIGKSEKIYSTLADKDGIFYISIPQQLANTVIYVTATDSSGNKGDPTLVTVLDKTPPNAPKVDTVTDNRKELSGMAEPNSRITIIIGKKEYYSAANDKGSFKASIPQQKAGIKIIVRATDTSGNISEKVTITVLDKTPPAVPKINNVTTKTTTINGVTEPFATITVKVANKLVGTTTSNKSGKFSLKIKKLKKNTLISVTAMDKAKNVSKANIVTVK